MGRLIALSELKDHFAIRPEDAILLKQAWIRLKSGTEGIVTGVEPRKMTIGGPLITMTVSEKPTRVVMVSIEEIVFDDSFSSHLQLRNAINDRISAQRMRQEQREQRLREQMAIEQRRADERRQKAEAAAEERRREDEKLAEEERRRLQEIAEAQARVRAEHEARFNEHRELFERFDIVINDSIDPSDNILDILVRIEHGVDISDEELEFLRKKRFSAAVGHYYFRRFLRGEGNWLVPKACARWREAQRQDVTIDRIYPYVDGEHLPLLDRDHAVLNNLAAACFDLGYLEQARKLEEKSLELRPRDDPDIFKAYCLMVNICSQLGDEDGVAQYKQQAKVASPNNEGCVKAGHRTTPKYLPKHPQFQRAGRPER